MGNLRYFPLQRLREQYDLSVFFETGTGLGDGVLAAAELPFERIISVELDRELFAMASRRCAADARVSLLQGESPSVMRRILPTLSGNILLWLDAHFPGADFGLRSYTAERDLSVRTPLSAELSAIKECRHGTDVICIDDLWLYKEGFYGAGMLRDRRELVGEQTADFIYNALSPTHRIEEYMDSQGYLLALPKPGMLWLADSLTTTDTASLAKALDYAAGRFGSPLRLLELGTGRGDVARDLRRYLSIRGIELDYTGVDSERDQRVIPPIEGARIVLGDSSAVHHLVPSGYHVILVDACHCFEHVTSDFGNYGPKLGIGGLFVFHDTHPAVQGVKDYQRHGPPMDPLFHISARTALGQLGLLDGTRPGWELLIDEWDALTSAGGVVALRRTRP